MKKVFVMKPKYDDALNMKLRGIVGAADFVDPRSRLCPGGDACLVYSRGNPVMSDGQHLSTDGIWLMAPLLDRLFD